MGDRSWYLRRPLLQMRRSEALEYTFEVRGISFQRSAFNPYWSPAISILDR